MELVKPPTGVEGDQLDTSPAPESAVIRTLRNLFWWTALLVTLIVVDDLLFGPIAWGLAQISVWLAAVVGFTAMWGFSYWLVLVGLRPDPPRLAQAMLRRLQLERRSAELQAREASLKERLTSVGIAIPMSLLFGGVVTSLWLRRRDVVNDTQVRRLALYLTALYACEFVLLHAFGGGRLLAEALDAF